MFGCSAVEAASRSVGQDRQTEVEWWVFKSKCVYLSATAHSSKGQFYGPFGTGQGERSVTLPFQCPATTDHWPCPPFSRGEISSRARQVVAGC